MEARRKRWYADNDINQIMQRFRPIVPKPATGHFGSPVITTAPVNKRKYVRRIRRGATTYTTKNKRNNKSPPTVSSLFTLQLLPPRPEEDHHPNPKDSNNNNNDDDILLPTSSSTSSVGGGGGGGMNNKNDQAFSLWDPSLLDRTVETWVTVERVTGSCMDGRELGGGGGGGCTEEEKIMNLERDTCPGFISDEENKVNWVNMAYRKMVWDEEEEEGRGVAAPQVVVKLVALPDDNDNEYDELASLLGFACRVRVQFEISPKYSLEKQWRQIVVPCDVWRLKGLGGGLAWRLDVQAALSLGR